MEKVKNFVKRKAPFKKNNFSRKTKSYKRTGEGANLGNATSQKTRYLEKAKEALAIGDRVTAEFFFQHADHYSRIIDSFEHESGQQNRHVAADDKNILDTEISSGGVMDNPDKFNETQAQESLPQV